MLRNVRVIHQNHKSIYLNVFLVDNKTFIRFIVQGHESEFLEHQQHAEKLREWLREDSYTNLKILFCSVLRFMEAVVFIFQNKNIWGSCVLKNAPEFKWEGKCSWLYYSIWWWKWKFKEWKKFTKRVSITLFTLSLHLNKSLLWTYMRLNNNPFFLFLIQKRSIWPAKLSNLGSIHHSPCVSINCHSYSVSPEPV